jgi:hypothetical protein
MAMQSTNQIKNMKAYYQILQSSYFRTNGPDIDLAEVALQLVDQIKEADEDWVYIGEDEYLSLTDLVICLYWVFTDCHAGQGSDSYAALCQLGTIFSPNMSTINSEDDYVQECHRLICEQYIHSTN